MELADVLDSKSSGSDTVPVRPRPPAPTEFGHPVFGLFYFAVLFLHLCFYILYKALTPSQRLSIHKAVLLQNNIFLHNNSLTPADMRQHYLWGLPFLVSKIYYFEVRCSFVAIKILLCRSREMKQGCRLARLFGKSIMDFYARNQNFLMNTQPTTGLILFNYLSLFSRLTISSLRILVCSSSVSGYLIVGIAERSIPIAGGIEIRRNIAIAYLPSAAS